MRGGKRKGSGRKAGSIKDNTKMGISISSINAVWLRDQKKHGKSISFIIDQAITEHRRHHEKHECLLNQDMTGVCMVCGR